MRLTILLAAAATALGGCNVEVTSDDPETAATINELEEGARDLGDRIENAAAEAGDDLRNAARDTGAELEQVGDRIEGETAPQDNRAR